MQAKASSARLETLSGNGPYGASLCPRLSRRGRLICFLKRDSCGPAGGSRHALLVGKAGNEQRFYHQGAAHTVHTGTTAESARQGSRHRRLLCRMNCPFMGCCGFVEKLQLSKACQRKAFMELFKHPGFVGGIIAAGRPLARRAGYQSSWLFRFPTGKPGI